MDTTATKKRIELQAIETLKKLSSRLQLELNMCEEMLQKSALIESLRDGAETGLKIENHQIPDEQEIFDQISANVRQMTMGVWNAGGKLRRLVEENKQIKESSNGKVDLVVVEEN